MHNKHSCQATQPGTDTPSLLYLTALHRQQKHSPFCISAGNPPCLLFPGDKFQPKSETRCGAAQGRGWMDLTGLPFPTSRPSSLILLSAFLSVFQSPSIFQSFPPAQPLHLSQMVNRKPAGSSQEHRGQGSSDCATLLHVCYQNGSLSLIHRLRSTALWKWSGVDKRSN